MLASLCPGVGTAGENMNINVIKAAACIAWAGVAVLEASPASAIAITQSQRGDYATCVPDYQGFSATFCGEWQVNYEQFIRFVAHGCNAGGCSATYCDVWTDFVYGTGRKMVTYEHPQCDLAAVYELGTCSC
jgi:hypothetical protein